MGIDDTATMNTTPWARSGVQPRIAIVGAGMSGIAAVIKLEKAGYTDVTVFEKAGRLGGTWRENTYPGLSCDIPSRWYCYSFALKAAWSHRYSYGPEIQAYLEDVAHDFGVVQKIKFNTAVLALEYRKPHWRLTTENGETLTVDIVISATGILHHPILPDIPGRDSFAGAAFHSARWDHSVDWRGKRVGVIGTGSTACQIIGAITQDVSAMHVFQRTPQWVAPLPQKAYSATWKRVMALCPPLQRLAYHFYFQSLVRVFSAATVGNTFMQRLISKSCERHLRDQVPDEALREKLTPNYQATCKRLIFCSDFYTAIGSPQAHLHTESIECIEPSGVRTWDGELHELDILIMATGFDAAAFILPTQVTGDYGRDLATTWAGAPRAHRAVAVPGFPNFWMLEGPTGPVGNLSLITISEYQVDYIISMLDTMKAEGLTAIAARQDAYERYNEELVAAIPNTTWASGGCDSWYFDASGKPNLYPFPPTRYLRDMRAPQLDEYHLSYHEELA